MANIEITYTLTSGSLADGAAWQVHIKRTDGTAWTGTKSISLGQYQAEAANTSTEQGPSIANYEGNEKQEEIFANTSANATDNHTFSDGVQSTTYQPYGYGNQPMAVSTCY